jgi:hypothetical protein
MKAAISQRVRYADGRRGKRGCIAGEEENQRGEKSHGKRRMSGVSFGLPSETISAMLRRRENAT